MSILAVIALCALGLLSVAAICAPLFCWWVDRECEKAEKLKRERRRNRAPVIHGSETNVLQPATPENHIPVKTEPEAPKAIGPLYRKQAGVGELALARLGRQPILRPGSKS